MMKLPTPRLLALALLAVACLVPTAARAAAPAVDSGAQITVSQKLLNYIVAKISPLVEQQVLSLPLPLLSSSSSPQPILVLSVFVGKVCPSALTFALWGLAFASLGLAFVFALAFALFFGRRHVAGCWLKVSRQAKLEL